MDGALVRSVVHAEGVVAEGRGAPLPEEQDLPDPALEDWGFALVARLTGVRWGDLVDARYQVLGPG